MKKYGFIGLGSQGAPIARRMIDAGLPTILWARRPASLEPFAATRAEYADSIEELASQVDYVGLCVVDNADVEEVCSRLMPAMRKGAYIVVHSTVQPELCQSLAAKARQYHLGFVDAPVSGGAPGAEAGTLTVMVGGTAEDFAATTPVFQTFGRLIVHLGDIGAGQRAKIINNSMLAANIAIGHYGLEAATALGIDRDEFINLVKLSSGHSFGFDVCARMPTPSSFHHGATMLDKDVRLLEGTLEGQLACAVLSDTAHSFLKLALA